MHRMNRNCGDSVCLVSNGVLIVTEWSYEEGDLFLSRDDAMAR